MEMSECSLLICFSEILVFVLTGLLGQAFGF